MRDEIFQESKKLWTMLIIMSWYSGKEVMKNTSEY